MPTQSMSPSTIARTYGTVTGLLPAVPEQPIAPGMPAGSVTDDTEQAFVFADLLITGRTEPPQIASALSEWEDRMRAKGSLDLLGPSTRRAIQAVRDGVPATETGRTGTTNGAAMRIAPAGIACPSENPSRLLDTVERLSLVTHNTGIALSGAAAVAGAISAGLDGAGVSGAIEYGLARAAEASTRGHWVAAADVAARTAAGIRETAGLDAPRLTAFLRERIGTSLLTQESVPAALILAVRFADAPWQALLQAANLGGDTDTIGAMCGAVLGACGADFPAAESAQVLARNALPLDATVRGLLGLRERG